MAAELKHNWWLELIPRDPPPMYVDGSRVVLVGRISYAGFPEFILELDPGHFEKFRMDENRELCVSLSYSAVFEVGRMRSNAWGVN